MRARRIEIAAVAQDLQIRNLRCVIRTAVRAINDTRFSRRKSLESVRRRVPETLDTLVARPGDRPHSPRSGGNWIALIKTLHGQRSSRCDSAEAARDQRRAAGRSRPPWTRERNSTIWPNRKVTGAARWRGQLHAFTGYQPARSEGGSVRKPEDACKRLRISSLSD